MPHTFTTKLWLYSSEKASWHFVTLPEDLSSDIADKYALKTHTSCPSKKLYGELNNSLQEILVQFH